MLAQYSESAVALRRAGKALSGRPSLWPLEAWLLLNGLDALLTWLGLHYGAGEGNPGIAFLVDSLGPEGAMALKLVVALIMGGLVWRAKRSGLWKGLNWAMAGVVTWNLLVLGSAL